MQKHSIAFSYRLVLNEKLKGPKASTYILLHKSYTNNTITLRFFCVISHRSSSYAIKSQSTKKIEESNLIYLMLLDDE